MSQESSSISSPTKAPERPRIPGWVWPVVAVAIVVGAIIWSGAREQLGPHGEHIVRSNEEYMAVLGDAQKLSESQLVAYDAGRPLSEKDLADIRAAAQKFEELSLFAPAKMAPYFGAGRCHLLLGERQPAEDDFRQCILNMRNESNPQTFKQVASLGAEAQYFLAQCLIMDHKYQEALDSVNLALGERPGVPQYMLVRAQAEIQLNELDLAKKDLDKVKQKDPANAPADMLLKMIANEQGLHKTPTKAPK